MILNALGPRDTMAMYALVSGQVDGETYVLDSQVTMMSELNLHATFEIECKTP